MVDHLVHIGLVERIGRGRASRVILSRGMYRYLGEPGSYTRYRGLDRETNKQMILKHVEHCGAAGASLAEFREVLPQLTLSQIRHLVSELRDAGLIHRAGWANQSRWHSTAWV
jgi:ATP-dependent DNA helicase RecG